MCGGWVALYALFPILRGQETVITSQTLRLLEGVETDHFYFEDTVEVLSDSLFVSCHHLHVVSKADSTSPSGAKVQMGTIETMKASGNVYIRQEDKEAWAQEAEVFPEEEKLVLTHNARLKDERGVVEGHRITLFKGQKEAIVEGPTDKASRPTLILHQIPQKKPENALADAPE